MLNEHTLEQLRSLRLDGMIRAIEEQATSTAAGELSFDERLTLLVQREIAWRDDRRVARLLKAARLKVSAACIEDINWRASRSLDRALIATLAGGDWLRHARNLLITGATGCGKTWLACALRIKPRAAASRRCTCGRRGCSTNSKSPTATAASPGVWPSWPSSISWSSMTLRFLPSARPSATTCSSCSTIASARARP
jgi:hypothetical protein